MLLASACGGVDPRSEALSTTSAAIINGQPSGPARDAVVAVKLEYTDRGELRNRSCSAVLVAPNLIATAKHCVFGYTPTECSPEGVPPPGSEGYIAEGAQFAVVSSDGAIRARPLRVVSLETTSFCRDDLAFVMLDTPLVGPIAPLRATRETRAGEAVIVAGYGDGANGVSTGARFERSDLTVSSVGPASAIGEGGAVAGTPRTFVLPGGAICFGDSGGGIYSKETGAVIGIPSRNAVSNTDQDVSVCLDAHNFLTSVDLARYESLTEQAFAAAGYPRWIEGAPHPNEGASCATDADCNGIPCALPEGRCAQHCGDEQACPSAFRCAPPGDSLASRETCVAEPNAADAGAAPPGAAPDPSPFRVSCTVSQRAPGAPHESSLAAVAGASLALCAGAWMRASRRRRGLRT